MKKKIKSFLFILLGVASLITILHVSALFAEHPENLVNVTETGETTHGNYYLDVSDVNPNDVYTDQGVQKSNYIARVTFTTDPGYYVKSLSVKQDNEDLVLGFIAGAEQGAFFRQKTFTYTPEFYEDNIYEFFIPEDTTEQSKVEVIIEYAKKDKIDISYMNYTASSYDDESLMTFNNYGAEEILVDDYMDGDLVLPEDMVVNGGALKFQFNQENYNTFKNMRAEAIVVRDGLDDRLLDSVCDDNSYTCYVIVKKDFKELSIGDLLFGYNRINIFVPNYAGFDAEGDVNNFNDMNLAVGFNPNSLEDEIEELFYGTKVLTLYNKVPNEIVNDNKTNNCGPVLDFDDVTGSGYGYNATYDPNIGTLVINFSSFYQNEIVVELTLTNNGQNIFNDKVKIKINRFAFSGELLEVDSTGRNCQEANNNNTCDQGRYYSVQYRGVLSAFYSDGVEETLDSIAIVETNGDQVEVNNWNQNERAYRRNTSFTPYALALFYDDNGMIVDTATFNLNREVNGEGYVTREHFQQYFPSLMPNYQINRDYIRFDHYHEIPIEQLDLFSNVDNASIMHQIVLMSKADAESLHVKKIALFLVNGEIAEDEIPALTYGVGEGKVLEIRPPYQPPQNNNGGND